MGEPHAAFAVPEHILWNRDLTTIEKIELLREWEYDERQIAVAQEEGMSGPEPELLGRILRGLDALTGGLDLDHSPPTKQGGSMV